MSLTFYYFLSSVDVHNHYLVQKVNPNAIAIVYSDKYNKAKIYQLTYIGMKTIEACISNPSEHHRHEIEEEHLYTLNHFINL